MLPESLRTRIAAAVMESCHGVFMDDAVNAADAVIEELDMAIPCATNGCRMRKITKFHAETSGGLTDSGDAK